MFANAGFDVALHHAYVPRDLSTSYDLLTVIALPGFVSKKLNNRWVMWPAIRRLYSGLIARTIQGTLPYLQRGEGTLFFYSLKKRDL